MSDFETTPLNQVVADNMQALVHCRLAQAKPVEILSDRGDKLLQVMEEANGQRFVKRSFGNGAVYYIERHGLSFNESWDAMHTVFSSIGAPVVKSVLFKKEGEYPYVAISKYLAEKVPVSSAPLKVKKKLAHGLGQMLKGVRGYMPAPEMVNGEMFQVTEQDGNPTVVLIDVDPYMVKKPRYGADTFNAHYIERIGGLLYDEWCTDNDDRGEVMRAFVRSVGDIVPDDIDRNPETFTAFSNVHLMSQGVDARQLGMFRQ